MAQQESKFDVEKVRIVGIETKVFAVKNTINNKSFDEIRSYATTQFSINYGLGYGIDLENNALGVEIGLEVVPALPKDTVGELNLETNIYTHFQIENLSHFTQVNEAEKSIIITNGLAEILVSIAFSTLRGIVFERTFNTPFAGLILPITRPDSLLKGTKVEEQNS